MMADCWFEEDGCTGSADGRIEATVGIMKMILPACENCAKEFNCEVSQNGGEDDG